jgi:hypothetical protein
MQPECNNSVSSSDDVRDMSICMLREKEKMVTKVVKDVKEQRKSARSKVPKGFFEIDKIVTHREKEDETGYSIRWKGYEQAIGIEVTKEEVAEFIVKGGKILNAKFVYKLEDAQDRVLLLLHYVDDLHQRTKIQDSITHYSRPQTRLLRCALSRGNHTQDT